MALFNAVNESLLPSTGDKRNSNLFFSFLSTLGNLFTDSMSISPIIYLVDTFIPNDFKLEYKQQDA